VVAPAYLKRAQSLYEGRVIPYLMEADRCLDIDSPFDFKLVEFLMNSRLEETNHG
jgi:N-acylneuraminate cytidylyltransferase